MGSTILSKYLIILESPGKIKTFKKHLGPDYVIVASYGHVFDLPAGKISVNIKKDFEPTFAIKEDKIDVFKGIISAAKKSDTIYLMMDEDREGCGIAKGIYDALVNEVKSPIYRCCTNEITKKGILKALASPGKIDTKKIDAYETRRILDRLAGYKTSFLTKQATGGRSAGRVQSSILRIMVDREQEIIAFVPQEYWTLTANLISSKGDAYVGTLGSLSDMKIDNKEKASKIYDKVSKSSPVVTEVVSKDAIIKPYAPFVTSQLLMASGTILGWNATKTMSVAQSLYQNSHISYHRTDAPFMAAEAVSDIRSLITSDYGQQYLSSSPKIYTAKKGSQEAHECCRPTNINMTPQISHLGGDEASLYNIIWRRAVASQMKNGQDRRLKAITTIGGYKFISKGNLILFDGFRKCWIFTKTKDETLPDLFVKEECKLKSLEKTQHFTAPPPRYSDASIIKKCEKEQIGRPATYASLLKVLQDRGYAIVKKKTFHPTELGIKVIEFLKKSDMCFVDIKFTSQLEDKLDKIQEGTADKLETLSEFWDRLKSDIEKGKEVKDKQQLTDFDCPKCDGKLMKKHSYYGPFFSCQNYKKPKKGEEPDPASCQFIGKVGDHGEPVEKTVIAKEYADFKCKKCNSPMIKRKSKFGVFCGCSKFPGCRMTSDMEGNFKEPKKKWKYKKKPK